MTCSLSTDARMVVWPVSDDAAANVDCLDSIPRNFSDNASTRRVTESRGTRRDAAPGPAAVLNGLPSFCSFAQLRAYSVKPEGKLMKQRISRRQFLTTSAAAPVVLSAAGTLAAGSPKTGRNPGAGAWVAWLDGKAPEVAQGVTWGVPWPRGKQRAKEFVLRDAAGKALSLQNWPLAYWPDGTLKWTAHSLAPDIGVGDGPFEVVAQRAATKLPAKVVLAEFPDSLEVDTGRFVCRIAKRGAVLIPSIVQDGRERASAGRLVLLRQDRAASSESGV